ncbi:hypothetical protein IPV09_07840 [Tessaracoccus sp. SD287]|nr:hypothetical protein [Tessaracoccus sp. SD287]
MLPPPGYGMPPGYGTYGYRPLKPEPPKPSAKRKLAIIIVLALTALAFVGSIMTPLVYPAGQPWSGGIFLWQWTPHLLTDQTEFTVGAFVFFFITTIGSAVGALLASAGVMGRMPTIVWLVVVGLNLLVALFMLLIVAVAGADESLSVGPALWLNMAGMAGVGVALGTARHRAVWMRESTV